MMTLPRRGRHAASGAKPRSRTRRYIKWGVIIAVLGLVAPVADSYFSALTGPGTDALSVRSIEWLRDHHFRWLVNDIENWWYTHHQPKKGGLPSPALQEQLSGGARALVSPGQAKLPVPSPVTPLVSSPLPGEGQWSPLGRTVNGNPAMYVTYMRPDDVHTSLVSALVWIDPKLVRAVGYAGAVEPGGSGWADQLPVAESVRPQLLAAFNSGFKMSDSRGGYYEYGRYARPLRAGAATLWIGADGTPHVGEWGRDVSMNPSIVFARQNLSLIVDNGQPVPSVSSNDPAIWGWTVGNKVLVWRSGVGETAGGQLVYAAGPGLSVYTLARLLARAGAVRAMELDINSDWVAFDTYSPDPGGPGGVTGTKVLVDMVPSIWKFLTASSRDAIVLFAR
jgi:hypothetical protein